MTFIKRNGEKAVLYIFFNNYMFRFKRSMSVFESFELLNVISACTFIHHDLAQGMPCIAKTARSLPLLDWD